MKKHSRGRRIRRVLIYSVLFVIAFIFWSNWRVNRIGKQFTFSNISSLPACKTALVPGTSARLANGSRNPYFTYRIRAAAELYKSGKIKHILVSGDNGTQSYNEPEDMRNALIREGIPAAVIHLDYAGFDTYDSMIRAKEIFGQRRFIVVSQEFHARRAVYIARSNDIQAWGYACQDVHAKGSAKVRFRELFARVKAYLDVKFGVDPTYLGKSEAF